MIQTTLEQLDLSRLVRPADRIAWGQAAAEPLALSQALMAQRHRIGGRFSVFLGVTWGDAVRARARRCNRLSGVLRDRRESEAFRSRRARRAVLSLLGIEYTLGPGGPNQVGVLMLQVAPPGPDGRYSLSAAHEYLGPLIDTARLVIAEVNEQAPWTYGPRELVEADIDVLVPTNHALASGPSIAASETELAIGRRVSELIGDGATLQLGLGTVPDAVLSCLHDRRDLGIHSGAISDAVAALAESGVITNSRKAIDNGKTIVGVLMGGARLHEYVHHNPQVELRDTAYTHSVKTISALNQFIAINSAVEVDLTGQVNAEIGGGPLCRRGWRRAGLHPRCAPGTGWSLGHRAARAGRFAQPHRYAALRARYHSAQRRVAGGNGVRHRRSSWDFACSTRSADACDRASG